jgi:hypothetical protein
MRWPHIEDHFLADVIVGRLSQPCIGRSYSRDRIG